MIIKHLQSELLRRLWPGETSNEASLRFYTVGGGSINETYRIVHQQQEFFCKINDATPLRDLFEKEKNGLQLIARQGAVKTPAVIDCFESGNHQVLVLEWINSGQRTGDFWKKFGEQLARLHQHTAGQFGLDHNNYMGSVLQKNEMNASWPSFFIENRLKPMVDQCTSRQLLPSKYQGDIEKLYNIIPEIFADDQKPALLHGDLWNGNFMCDEKSAPVMIDPAVYYGHPAVDLGMTTLFGGFDPGFYDAYHYHKPLPRNHQEQWQISNLYPLLIHLLLFGRSYLSQIDFTLSRFSR